MKRGLIIASFLILGILFASLVSAARDPFQDFKTLTEKVVNGFTPFVSYVLGDIPSGDYMFAKLLFLLIILAIVWTALDRVDFFAENTWVLVVVSIAVSILAVRFLTTASVIETILLPYSALGIVISAGLPFVLFFLLVNVGFADQPSIIRKVAWIFFAVVFIGLFISRVYLSETSAFDDSYIQYIYPVTALVAFIMAVMDGTIHRFFVKLEMEKAGKRTKLGAIQDIERRLGELPNLVSSGVITQREANKREKHYKKQLAFLHK